MLELFDFANIFLLGLAVSLQPCLFPVLPTFVAFLSTDEDTNKLNGIFAGLLVMFGIMTVFLVLAILFQELITFFTINIGLFSVIQGLLLIILGILLITGLTINNRLIDKIASFGDSVIHKVENKWVTSYLIGLMFTLIAAPCGILYFITGFVYIGNQTISNAIFLTVVFAFASALPFLIMGGLVPSMKEKLIKNRQQIEKYVSISAGLLIIIAGIYLTYFGYDVLT